MSLYYASLNNLSSATAINNSSQVVGWSAYSSQGCCPDDGTGWHAFLWQTNTGMISLGDIGGGTGSSGARSINNNGIVVGLSVPDSGTYFRPFQWSSGGGIVNLGTTSSGLPYFGAMAVNDQGAMALGSWSFSGAPGNPAKGYFYSGGNWNSIGDLTNGVSEVWPAAINNANQICGHVRTTANYPGYRAFIWNSNAGMVTLQSPAGYQDSGASAINGNSSIAGYSMNSNGVNHAILWLAPNYVPLDLGSLVQQTNYSSFGNSLNLQGQVVGSSQVSSNISHAFVWDSQTGMTDLNSNLVNGTEWAYLENASGINDKGEIVGQGVLTNGTRHAFTLFPVVQTTNLISVTIALYPGVKIDGVVGLTYGIQYSTNLADTNSWIGVTNLTFTVPMEIWYDSVPASYPSKFFRVLQGPIPIP